MVRFLGVLLPTVVIFFAEADNIKTYGADENDEIDGDLLATTEERLAEEDDEFDRTVEDNLIKTQPVIPQSVEKQHYYYEAGCAVLLLLYLWTWYSGADQNRALARQWCKESRQLFDSQFASVGVDPDEGVMLMQDGYAHYEFYASGRQNCQSCTVMLDLKWRQDLFTTYLLDLIWPNKDTVTFNISLNTLDSISLGLARKKDHKAIFDASYSTIGFGKVRETNPAFVCLSDTADAVGLILTSQILKTLANNDCFVALLVFDEILINDRLEQRKTLQCIMRIPKDGDMTKLAALGALVFYLVDIVATLRLSDKVRQASHDQRQKVLQDIFRKGKTEREDRLAYKKAEKKQEEAEKTENLTAEQLRKREEKERKKSLKQRMPKMKIMR